MSTYVDEKLEVRRPSTGGHAQSTGKKLLERWGSKRPDAQTIVIDTIGGREVWRQLDGDQYVQEVRS